MTDVMLEGRGLTCRYGGVTAVAGVSFTVRRGEILGLIGPNGAGKTTLISMLSGTVHTTAGDAYLKGTRTTGLKPHQITRLGLGRTFQLVKPLSGMTVMDNVTVGALFGRQRPASLVRDIADHALRRVGLEHKAQALSATLAIGELKRLELARVLAMEPDVLLLDELMGGLSGREVDAMTELVQRLSAENAVATMMVDHVLKAVMRISDRIVVLQHGERVAEGLPAEVAANPVVLSGYLGTAYSRSRHAGAGSSPR